VNGNAIAKAEKLHDIVSQSYRSLKTNIPLWRQSLALYIANGETENILFSPVKVCVLLNQFLLICTNSFSEKGYRHICTVAICCQFTIYRRRATNYRLSIERTAKPVIFSDLRYFYAHFLLFIHSVIISLGVWAGFIFP
jgi:hypothetical protein